MCMCVGDVHMCSDVHVYLFAYTWRPEVILGFPLVLLTLGFEIKSFTGLEHTK